MINHFFFSVRIFVYMCAIFYSKTIKVLIWSCCSLLKTFNNLPLSVSCPYLEIACFAPAHFNEVHCSVLLLRKTKNSCPLHFCTWTTFPSCKRLLLACHKTVSSFFSLKLIVALSEMHSLNTCSKLRAIHQLLHIPLFISVILECSNGWKRIY